MIRDAWETLSRVLASARRRTLDREFDEEFATHLELLTEQNERRGLPRHEARRRAILQMGGLNPTRELHRESRGLPRVERTMEAIQAVGKDLRHAARSLARARAFTFVCVISLGVGMGAFVALVTFVRALTSPARGIETTRLVEVLVRPLGPLRAKAGVGAIEEWSYPDFQELRRADTGMALTGWTMGVTDIGLPRPETLDREAGNEDVARVLTLFVTPNYFSTLGVSLARGPGFDSGVDDAPAAPPRVVVSHGFWQNRMGSDPEIVGKTLPLDGVAHTVVGIAPPDFSGHFNALDDSASSSMLFMPLERHPRLRADPYLRLDRTIDWVNVHGRLAPGVDLARANAGVSATMATLANRYPGTNEFKTASVEPYFSQGAANRAAMRRTSSVILGLAGMVLLIVCVNISGMMLVRGATRERELSIREAVGASRRRLIQYLFFEAVWLAAISGGLSVLVLFGIPAAVARYLGIMVPPEFDLDLPGIAIAGALCLAVSVVLGLLPALRLSRPNLIPALKDDAAGGGRRVSRIHRAAAAIQVAIAVPFLVISGVMLDRVRTAEFGFVTEGLVAARVDPAAASRGGADVSLRSLQGTLQAAAGAPSVSMADGMPIDFAQRRVRVAAAGGTQFVSAHVTRVAEGYLDTLGVRLLRGRAITADDRSAAARVAVISEPLAAKLHPDREAVGERMTLALDSGRDEEYTIVGVTADFATSQLTTERPQMLLPLAETPASAVYLIARGAAADEMRLASAFENMGRDAGIEFLPSRLSVFRGIVTGTQLVDKSQADLVSESVGVAMAGGIVLVLASLGVLGVIAFMVATRTREIAVRMALGATRPRVLGLMLAGVVKLVTPGVGVGLLLGAILIRTMDQAMGTPLTVGSNRLGAVEPLIYATAAFVALVVALLAGFPAARRAASIQPMIAMRAE
jgi:predicted permease